MTAEHTDNLSEFKMLEIEGRPELADFPVNVVFTNLFPVENASLSISASYEPDLGTYISHGDWKSLKYRNTVADRDDILILVKQPDKWQGVKLIENKLLLFVEGETWEDFHSHLTGGGLSSGESCNLDVLFEEEDHS